MPGGAPHPRPPVRLAVAERDALRRSLRPVTIEPAPDSENAYILTPGATIGALEIGDLSVSIRPKLDVSRVLFLASYGTGAFRLRERERFSFPDADTPVEALVPVFTASARRAFASGLVHGYRTEEETLDTVRGRIRIDDQIRRRFGIPVPVEVTYDEFTDDVLINRLVKAATEKLSRMRIRSCRSRADLGWVDATLGNVALVEYPPGAVPDVAFNRLNEHYREVVALARLILRNATLETGRGAVRAPGFLMDMNKVFQEFVTQALREALGLSDRTFRADCGVRGVTLDVERRIDLRPDLSWWDGPTCTFVGDAKYKRIQDSRVPNADLYQLLAYATALNLPGGLLVYAQGEADDTAHVVRHASKRLEVSALDLSGTIGDLRRRIQKLAERVRCLRRAARAASRVA
ncbi:MAG: hypothetical protein OXG35_30685 [Acidobacteria bacterium]|nr:hypothetical protein [Acidobacteriota bacterium]